MKYRILHVSFIVVLLTSLTVQVKAQILHWTNKANLPSHHWGGGRAFGIAQLNGKIYLVGGYCGPHCDLATTDEYDPTLDTWTPKANMLETRYSPAAAAVNGKLYAIGGYASAGGPAVLSATVEEYDPLSNTWSNRASMSQARFVHRAVTLDGKIYVIGGQGGDGSITLASVEVYDPVSNTWSPRADMPTPRTQFSATTLNGKIYVFGGDTYGGGPIPAVYEYDPLSNTWATRANIPTNRGAAAAAAINGKIWVMGGNIEVPGGSAAVEEYDPTSNSWHIKPNLPTARNECFSVVLNDALYVFGGYNDWTMQAAMIQPVLEIYTAIELRFLTMTGKVHQLQASPNLNTWTNFDSAIVGDGNYWSKLYSTRETGGLFFRLYQTP